MRIWDFVSPKLDEAVEFLKEALSEGPVASKELERMAKDANISKDTLRRAREKIGAKPQVDFDENDEKYYAWRLPEKSQPSEQMKQLKDYAAKEMKKLNGYLERTRKMNPQLFDEKP